MHFRIYLGGKAREELLNLLIALLDLALVVAVCVHRLAQGEEVLASPGTHQRLGDRLFGGPDARMAQLGQLLGRMRSGADRIQHGEAGLAGQIAEDVVQLQVRQRERFLHVLDVRSGHLHQGCAMTQHCAHGRDRLRRMEGAAQQTDRMQVLQPLTVEHVGFATGRVDSMATEVTLQRRSQAAREDPR